MSIEISGLTKRYKDAVAVDNINFKIKDGELFALFGMNGAGKSTTINMLSCVLRPDSGDAFIMQKSIVKNLNEVKRIISTSPQ